MPPPGQQQEHHRREHQYPPCQQENSRKKHVRRMDNQRATNGYANEHLRDVGTRTPGEAVQEAGGSGRGEERCSRQNHQVERGKRDDGCCHYLNHKSTTSAIRQGRQAKFGVERLHFRTAGEIAGERAVADQRDGIEILLAPKTLAQHV